MPVINATTAPTASALTATSATISGSLDANGGEAITQHGFVYSKTVQTPTLADSKTELGATTGPFPLTISSNLTGLEANTTYYLRPYATNAKGTGYGAVGQLKTEATGVAGEITRTWVEKAKFPVEPRGYGYHLVPVNGKIYLQGVLSWSQQQQRVCEKSMGVRYPNGQMAAKGGLPRRSGWVWNWGS